MNSQSARVWEVWWCHWRLNVWESMDQSKTKQMMFKHTMNGVKGNVGGLEMRWQSYRLKSWKGTHINDNIEYNNCTQSLNDPIHFDHSIIIIWTIANKYVISYMQTKYLVTNHTKYIVHYNIVDSETSQQRTLQHQCILWCPL